MAYPRPARADKLLTFAGRRGRMPVCRILAADPTATWTIADLRREADVPHMTAVRTVRELVALGAVEMTRRGRASQVKWRPRAPAARWLARLYVPDVARQAVRVFARRLGSPEGLKALYWWHAPGDEPEDPEVPVRIAVVFRGDDEAVVEAVGPALDACRRRGLPVPDATLHEADELDPNDPTGAAILAGQRVERDGPAAFAHRPLQT